MPRPESALGRKTRLSSSSRLNAFLSRRGFLVDRGVAAPVGVARTHRSFPKKRAPPQGLSRFWGAGWATATLGMTTPPSTRLQGSRPSRLVCRPLKIFIKGLNFAAPPRYRLGLRLFCSDMPVGPALCLRNCIWYLFGQGLSTALCKFEIKSA